MSDRLRSRAALTSILVVALAPSLAWSGELLRDPTRPPARIEVPDVEAPASAEHGAFDLQAVFIAPDRRVAIINEERVRERDQIAGARVLRIQPDRVELQLAGRRFQLELLAQPDTIHASGLERSAPSVRNSSIERADP